MTCMTAAWETESGILRAEVAGHPTAHGGGGVLRSALAICTDDRIKSSIVPRVLYRRGLPELLKDRTPLTRSHASDCVQEREESRQAQSSGSRRDDRSDRRGSLETSRAPDDPRVLAQVPWAMRIGMLVPKRRAVSGRSNHRRKGIEGRVSSGSAYASQEPALSTKGFLDESISSFQHSRPGSRTR